MMNLNEKSYNTVLTEANDFFAAQGISIIGEGYKEIATSPNLFESYVDQLTEGTSADHAAVMAQLMANTNSNILKESSLTGIQPIASLSMPVIRKLWPKFALKDALKTEVAKSPRFVVSYTAPYMFRGDDEKVYIPRGLKTNALEKADPLKKTYVDAEKAVKIASGAAEIFTFNTEITSTPSAAKKQPLDELVLNLGYLVSSADETKVDGKTYYTEAGEVTDFAKGTVYEAKPIKIGKRLGVYGNGVYPFGEKGQLIVQFDGANATATLAVINGSTVVGKLTGIMSSEYNEDSWSVGFDIKRQDIDIPSGQHINAPLPIEALNDMMALYQIDGTKETVDLMTNIFAQKLDVEVMEFLQASFINQPGNEAFADYPEASEYCLSFNCRPAAGFAGSPKAWREEIKPLIDHLAQKIKNETYLQAGIFTIVANPLDAQILANVDWQFRGGQGGNMDGVDVDYSVGTYIGANSYRVISTPNVPQGSMYVLFTPSSETQMTYKYYPYTFSTEVGYTDPNRSRVPSLMMTKRHQLHEFMPAIGCIVIVNNDGKGYFRNSVTDWKSSEADV